MIAPKIYPFLTCHTLNELLVTQKLWVCYTSFPETFKFYYKNFLQKKSYIMIIYVPNIDVLLSYTNPELTRVFFLTTRVLIGFINNY